MTKQAAMIYQVDEGYREELVLRNKLLDEQRDIVYSSLPIPEVRLLQKVQVVRTVMNPSPISPPSPVPEGSGFSVFPVQDHVCWSIAVICQVPIQCRT